MKNLVKYKGFTCEAHELVVDGIPIGHEYDVSLFNESDVNFLKALNYKVGEKEEDRGYFKLYVVNEKVFYNGVERHRRIIEKFAMDNDHVTMAESEEVDVTDAITCLVESGCHNAAQLRAAKFYLTEYSDEIPRIGYTGENVVFVYSFITIFVGEDGVGRS